MILWYDKGKQCTPLSTMAIDIQHSTHVLDAPTTDSLIAYHSEKQRDVQLLCLQPDGIVQIAPMDASKRYPYERETLYGSNRPDSTFRALEL